MGAAAACAARLNTQLLAGSPTQVATGSSKKLGGGHGGRGERGYDIAFTTHTGDRQIRRYSSMITRPRSDAITQMLYGLYS